MSRWRAGCRTKASPEGRRTKAYFPANNQNLLNDTVTRLQRVCGQPYRGPRRQVFVAGGDYRGPRRQVFVAGVEAYRESRRGRSTAGD